MVVKFGITRHEGEFVQSLDLDNKADAVIVKNSKGVVKRVGSINPTTDFNVKFAGEDPEISAGIGDPGITDLDSGINHINSSKTGETNEGAPIYDVSGTNYPEAEELDVS